VLGASSRRADLPAWWGDLDGRTVVHVSQGTVANTDLEELLAPTMRALADRDVIVVAATGGAPVESLGELPANARVAEFIPYDALMPRVDAFVSNGGYGGLHHALAHGVPMIVAGDTEDKMETTRRVEWSGAGINLRTARPTEARLGTPRRDRRRPGSGGTRGAHPRRREHRCARRRLSRISRGGGAFRPPPRRGRRR
jgi:UDP:flavonoid glycosyltransferase YjiC (YdhE family)